jgi:hypothetical protein
MPIEEVVATLAQETRNRYYGKYRGIVVDTNDPDQMGRLTAKVPSLLGDDVVIGWATPCVPYGGSDNLGFFMVPEKDAGVWIEFEGGDLEFPIWSGTYWRQSGGKSEAPKLNDKTGEEKEPEKSAPTCKIIKTKKGHTIQLEDKDGGEMILIKEAKNNHVIAINEEGITITVFDDKKTKLAIAKDNISITDNNENNIKLDNQGIAITDGVTSGNTVKMAGSGVTVEDAKGNKIEMAAGGMTIAGNMIKVGSSAAAEPFVLGNQLNLVLTQFLALLNAHTHTGNLGAPTGPPTPPATLVLTPALSIKHKVE